MLKLIEAEEKHSSILKTYFNEQVVSGHLDYSILRQGSFFNHYRLLSDNFTTLLLMDDTDKLLGTATVTFARAYVNHQEQNVAYLSDLRISPQREAIQNWAPMFVPEFYKKLEEKNCKYTFSIIESYESQAYNALLRPQKLKRHLPHYYLFRKINLHFFFGKWPFSTPPTPTIRLSHAQSSDIEMICEYLMKKKVGSKLYFNLTPEVLQNKFKQWPDFKIDDFILAKNAKDQLVGCIAPWNSQGTQQWVARGYRDESQLLYQTLKLTSPLRITRAMPDIGQNMNLKFITHCGVDNAEVFYALLNRAYEESSRQEVLAHTNYFGDYLTRPPKAFVSSKIPFGFYSVLPPESEFPSFLKPNPFSAPPDFNLVHL